MSRLLIICCLSLFVLAACKKANGDAAQVKEQAAKDDAYIANYVKQNNLTATKVMVGNQDTTGVWYVINTQGTGSNVIVNGSLVTVGFTGRILTTGTTFVTTDTFHPAFDIGQVIKGWQLGLRYSNIKKGGKIRILMASRYGYGPYEQPSYKLPANSILDFDIDIYDITN